MKNLGLLYSTQINSSPMEIPWLCKNNKDVCLQNVQIFCSKHFKELVFILQLLDREGTRTKKAYVVSLCSNGTYAPIPLNNFPIIGKGWKVYTEVLTPSVSKEVNAYAKIDIQFNCD
jgi:hypothetical protein